MDTDIDYKQLNDEVNRLAEQLVAHNPADINSSTAKKLQDRILDLIYSAYLDGLDTESAFEYDEHGNPARYYKLIDAVVPADVLFETVYKLVTLKEDGGWAYNPVNATFITALRYVLPRRVANYEKKSRKADNMIDVSVTASDSINKKVVLTDTHRESEDIAIHNLTKISVLVKAFDMFDEKFHNSTDKEKRYYSGFFTFDTTKAIKTSDDVGVFACKHNDQLFPYMLIALLEFLMVGLFEGIWDVAKNPLREGVNLKKRSELIAKHFRKSLKTISKYSKMYNELSLAIVGEHLSMKKSKNTGK